MLELVEVNSYYGQSHILHDVSLEVGEGETVGLLGRNGAGKTTTFKTICGLLRARRGRVLLSGKDVGTLKAHQVAREGIVYVPAGRRAFADLTVEENLVVAAHRQRSGGEAPRWSIRSVVELFPALDLLRDRRAGVLSGGEQQMLKLARALLAHPRLLLLDEPSEGLAPVIVQDLAQILRRLAAEEGLSILLAEQNLGFTLEMTSRCYVLEKGVIRMEGPSAALRDDVQTKRYLGV